MQMKKEYWGKVIGGNPISFLSYPFITFYHTRIHGEWQREYELREVMK